MTTMTSMSLARRLDASALAPEIDDGELDQRVRLHGVSWSAFLALLRIRGEDAPVPRVAYLDGEVELMSPGVPHETGKKRLARLIEMWSLEAGVDLDGIGAWLLKRRRDEVGVEPDECYIVTAGHARAPTVPDFAIEVVQTNPGIDKLEIYRRLGVREVWFWERGRLSFHVLRGDRYVRCARSRVVRDLDPASSPAHDRRHAVRGRAGLQRAMRRCAPHRRA